MKFLFFIIFISLQYLSYANVKSSSDDQIIIALKNNDFNLLLHMTDKYPWSENYLMTLLKTDLNFADQIQAHQKKLDLLEKILKKTKSTPNRIQVLKKISELQIALKLENAETLKEIESYGSDIDKSSKCKDIFKKAKVLRDLRKFEKSIDHFELSFKCHKKPINKLKDLKQITFTHKLKHRGSDFVNSSKRYYKFAKLAYSHKKITAKYFSSIGSEHARTLWTYSSVESAEKILDEIIKKLRGKDSLQNIYWIKSRLYEEKKDYKKSLELLELSLKEKKISNDDLISIYWQKFWNHYNLNKLAEAESALRESLKVGNPFKEQSRTHFWLIKVLEVKKNNFQVEKSNFVQNQETEKSAFISNIDKEIENLKKILTDKYPLSFYTALFKKNEGRFYTTSDIADLNSATYKKLASSLDFEFYKRIHTTSMLATQSFLNWYYSIHKNKMSKYQRLLIKRMLARNGDTLQLFLETEFKPEICQEKDSPCMDLFPEPYLDEVNTAAKKYNIPKELIYSIMRQESIFNPLAKSWADARGLMQLLPSIAKNIQEKAKVDYKNSLDLYSVDKNISLGSYLIQDLYSINNQSLVLALCGYNAERSKAQQWYKTRFKGDWLKFIEEIPYKETRNYNKLVLRNFLIYSNNNPDILKNWFPLGL